MTALDLSKLRVVGARGSLHLDAAPGRLEPVYADEIGELVDGAGLPVSSGCVTTAGPWPARENAHLLVLGERDVAALRSCCAPQTHSFHAFLRWLRHSRDARADNAERIPRVGAVVWYASTEDCRAAYTHLRGTARGHLRQALAVGHPTAEIVDLAWWLSRTAVDDEDVYLAGAALRAAGSPDWEAAVREGLALRPNADIGEGMWRAEALIGDWKTGVQPGPADLWRACLRTADRRELHDLVVRRFTVLEGPRPDDRLGEGPEDALVEAARADDGLLLRLGRAARDYFLGAESDPTVPKFSSTVCRGYLSLVALCPLPECAAEVREWFERHVGKAEFDDLGREALGALATTLRPTPNALEFWMEWWRGGSTSWQPRAFMGLRLCDPRAAALELPLLVERADASGYGPAALLLGFWKQPGVPEALGEWLHYTEGRVAARVRRELAALGAEIA